MESKKKFLNKKHKRFNKKEKKKKVPLSKSPLEELYQKAKSLYESSAASFDLDKIDLSLKSNKDKKWTHDILQTGTFDDKISSLVLYIKQNPKTTLKYIEILIRMATDKNRRKNESVMTATKDLFIENLLQNKKHLPFVLSAASLSTESSQQELIDAYYDDKIHSLYSKLISALEESAMNDPMTKIKKKKMDILYEMIAKQPEGEEKILSIMINKLGDPSTEVTNYAIAQLKSLQKENMKMSLIIFNNVKAFFTSATKSNAKLYSLVFMTQMAIPYNFPQYIEEAIKFFFDLFNKYSTSSAEYNKKDEKENANIERYLSLIVKRINDLFKQVKNQKGEMQKIQNIINEKINVLFKLSHNKSLKLSVEILKLLYGIIPSQDESFIDRYYKSLYEFISNSALSVSKSVKDALKLIMLSLMSDNKPNRVASFIKRLLSMCSVSEPYYIICILIIVSQVIRNSHKLWKMINKDQHIKGEDSFYDSMKRDPQFANGENSFLNELQLLTKHYHPSVQRMSKFILENYSKDVIDYEGDPLVDFSLVNFLEKFILKNPKIKKEKKKMNKGKVTEEEELQRFMKEDNEDANREEKEIEVGDDDLKFIDKFNKVYPKITNSKNYLKKLKKKEKKDNEDEVVDDEEEGAKDAIEKYADKVIEKEYQKLDHDVDDDDEGFEDVGEEEEGEDVDDVMEEEEGEDEGDFFGKEGTLESEDEEEVEDEDEPKKISKK